MMNKQISIALMTCSSCLMLSNMLFAAEPVPIKMGDFDARVLLDGSLEHSDNLFRASTNEDSSMIARVEPSVSLKNSNATRDIEFTYSAEAVKFFDFSDDDYVSNTLGADTVFRLSALNSLGFNAEYLDGNEQRGTGSSEGTNINETNGPTEFSEKSVGADYTYGNDNSVFGLGINLGYSDLEFDNFRLITAERDRETISLETSLDYKFSAATSVFLDLRYYDNDYLSATNSDGIQLDNTQLVAHLGLAWSATRKTTGRIGIGQTSKDVDAASDKSFGSWDAAIEWLPTQNDVITFEAVKDVQEPAGTGLFIESERTSATWLREISPKWSLNMFASITDAEFESETRQDDTTLYGIGATYRVSQQFDIAFNYEKEDKDSNIDDFDFDRNVFIASLSIGL